MSVFACGEEPIHDRMSVQVLVPVLDACVKYEEAIPLTFRLLSWILPMCAHDPNAKNYLLQYCICHYSKELKTGSAHSVRAIGHPALVLDHEFLSAKYRSQRSTDFLLFFSDGCFDLVGDCLWSLVIADDLGYFSAGGFRSGEWSLLLVLAVLRVLVLSCADGLPLRIFVLCICVYVSIVCGSRLCVLLASYVDHYAGQIRASILVSCVLWLCLCVYPRVNALWTRVLVCVTRSSHVNMDFWSFNSSSVVLRLYFLLST